MLNHSRILFEFFKRTLTRSTLLVLVAWFIYVILRRLNCFIHLVLIILRTEECEMSNFFVIFFIWVCVPSWSSFGKSKSCTTFKRIYDSSVWQNPLIILLCAIFECFFLLPLFLNLHKADKFPERFFVNVRESAESKYLCIFTRCMFSLIDTVLKLLLAKMFMVGWKCCREIKMTSPFSLCLLNRLCLWKKKAKIKK